MSAPAITEALHAWRRGDAGAEDELMRLVYPDLHRRAARALGGERRDHTLQPTALVHEAYLRLVDQRRVDWHDRIHFFAIAARLMRRVLLDHARKRGSAKRGGGVPKISLETAGEVAAGPPAELGELDEALAALAAFDPQGAAIVELRYFGGMTVEEAAQALGVSTATLVRQWRTARAWLHARLAGGAVGA